MALVCLIPIGVLSIPALVDLGKVLLLHNPENFDSLALKSNLELLVKQLGSNIQLGHCRCWTISSPLPQMNLKETQNESQNLLSPKATPRKSNRNSLLKAAPALKNQTLIRRPIFFALELLVPHETPDTKLIQDTLRAQRVVDDCLAGHQGSEAIVTMKRQRHS